jgi:transposase
MEKDTTIWVGMDVHKDTIAVHWLRGASDQEGEERQIANDTKSLRKLVKQLKKEGEVRSCYEAGPCGYVVRRLLVELGVHCDVIVPSKIPRMPGDRVKTDRRDARKLARYYRSGDLTVIKVPTKEQEAVRALLRCREDLLEDLHGQRQRLLKFLDQQGRAWREGTNWSEKHWVWLRAQKFEFAAGQRAYDEYLQVAALMVDRLSNLDKEVGLLAESEPMKSLVERLTCLRGIRTLTALTLIAEIQDFRRFESPRELMSFLGLTPSLYESANTRRAGSITKAGNAHARRVLVEAAWHYRHRPQLAGSLRQRCDGQPDWVRTTSMTAQTRLNYKFRKMTAKGKKSTIAVVAVARELAGFIWALMVHDQGGHKAAA